MKNFLIALMVTTLFACGGGGGGSSTDDSSDDKGGGTAPVIPSNTAPIVTVNSSFSLFEGATEELAFNAVDPDGDDITLGFVVSNPVLSVAQASAETLELQAGEVEQEQQVTLIVSANDGQTSSSATVTVLIKKTPPPDNYQAFQINWQSSDLTYQYALNGGETKYPFSLTLGSVPLSELTVNVTAKAGIVEGELNTNVLTSVDMQPLEVIVHGYDADYANVFSGILSVSDGRTTRELEFGGEFENLYRGSPEVDSSPIILRPGQSHTYEIGTLHALDPTTVKLSNFQMVTGNEDDLVFTSSNDGHSFTVKVPENTPAQTFEFFAYIDTGVGYRSGYLLKVYVTEATGANELDVIEKASNALNYLNQSRELEFVGKFVTDVLLLTNQITYEQAQDRLKALRNARSISNVDNRNQLSCILNAAINGRVTTIGSWTGYLGDDYVHQFGYICAVGEADTLISNENHYANEHNYLRALTTIEELKTYANNDAGWDPLGYQTLDDLVNTWLAQAKDADPSFNLDPISWWPMESISDELASRFYGNTYFGAYVGENWVWKTEYEALGVIVEMAQSSTKL